MGQVQLQLACFGNCRIKVKCLSRAGVCYLISTKAPTTSDDKENDEE